MTRAQLLTDLKARIGPGIGVSDSLLNTWLNEAYLYACGALSEANPDYFIDTATTTVESGRQEYDLPADFEQLVMVNVQYDGGWRRVEPVANVNSIPTLADSTSQTISEGAPIYYIYGDQIGLLPIPSNYTDTLKIWYVYSPAEMATDSESPALPAKYHSMLVMGAYANYLDRDEEHAAAEGQRRRFDDRIAQMVSTLSQLQVDQPKSVQIVSGTELYYNDDGTI